MDCPCVLFCHHTPVLFLLCLQQEARETDPDTELVTSEQISSTDAEDTRSVGTEDVSEVTTASESRIDDDKAHVHYEADVAAGTSQASAEPSVEATAEGETKAEAQADPDTSTRSQGDAEGDQSSEAGPSSAPMFLRPTIEIDTSDILHKAKVRASRLRRYLRDKMHETKPSRPHCSNANRIQRARNAAGVF